MAEGKTSMFGKTYNTIGSTDSNFIIKTKGDLKVQWGNKYIDVIKNGKIASEGSKILFIVNSPEEIKQDGVYIVTSTEGNELWVCIDGIKVQVENTSEETAYVSFLTEQKANVDQKHQALTNIGFYYEDLQQAKSAGILSGIIYVENDNKLYIAKNGLLTEYVVNQTITNSGEEIVETHKHPLYILDYSLWESGVEYIRCSGDVIQTLKQITAHLLILSADATTESGFRLYIDDLESILEIDRVLWRKYPNPVTYAELEKMMLNKKLNPKMYYMISDFQNPWEVTWGGESLYFEDLFMELNEELYIINYRNALKLIIKAKNEELIEQLVWSPLHPDWIIYYDPYYKGPEHIVIENEEEVKYYGFRTKTNDDGTIDYLPCKGKITYLKDEYGNEGNFNFRHHRYKKDIYDDVTDTYATVWRYCMDKYRINDSKVIYGEFFEKGMNNKFFFENNQTYNLLVSIVLEYDENNNITKYEFTDIEPDLVISEGQNLTIYSSGEIIENNIFEGSKEYPVKDSTINRVNIFTNNYIKDVFELNMSGSDIINNKIENIKEVSIMNSISDNIVLSIEDDKPTRFVVPRGLIFNKNHLENFTGLENFNHLGNFEENIIINSYILLLNTETDSISSGSIGDFNKNIIKDSEVRLYVSDFHTKVFESNTILDNCEIAITNHGTIINNNISQTEGTINNNEGHIESNIFNISNITIYNEISANIENNTITGLETCIISNENIIKNNTLDNCLNIDNKALLNDNIIKKNQTLYNTNEISKNTIEESNNITNESVIKDNTIGKIETINNYGNIENNLIIEANSLTNQGNFRDNTVNSFLYITNDRDIINNDFITIQNLNNLGTISDNSITNIIQIDNYGDIINNTVEHIENLNNSGNISDNNIKTIADYLSNNNTISNNTISLIESLTLSSDITYNTIEEIKIVTINGNFSENIFNNIFNSTFNGTTQLNKAKKLIINSQLNDLINNTFYLNIDTLVANGSIMECVFRYDIYQLYVNNLTSCQFDYINNLSLDRDAIYTTFHGSIGNPDRQLTEFEWELLGDGGKKTDAYPNMRVVCVPEIIKKGMILMWYGKEEIPKGWTLCDGNNGTPNLVGSFIKGDSFTSDLPTVPEGVDEETNEFTLKTEHLPKHQHPHKAHYHYFEDNGSDTLYDNYATEGGSYSVNEGEGSSTTSGKGVNTNYESETVDIYISGNTSSVTSLEDNWQYNDPPTPIKLEPKHFKIIFIMKIDENPW